MTDVPPQMKATWGQRTYTEWRAVVGDAPEDPGSLWVTECGRRQTTRAAAERDLREMLDEQPAYDDGWVECRTVTEWKRVGRIEVASEQNLP